MRIVTLSHSFYSAFSCFISFFFLLLSPNLFGFLLLPPAFFCFILLPLDIFYFILLSSASSRFLLLSSASSSFLLLFILLLSPRFLSSFFPAILFFILCSAICHNQNTNYARGSNACNNSVNSLNICFWCQDHDEILEIQSIKFSKTTFASCGLTVRVCNTTLEYFRKST